MTLLAPTAPGRISEPVVAAEMLTYLESLGTWVRRRREELDELDAAVLGSPHRERLTGDVMLSMALWQAVQERHELLLATWDSGRVGRSERERLASLVWGRLDATLDPSLLAQAGPGATGSGLAVSLPEACRLSDALAGQLRGALSVDPAGDGQSARVRELRAGLERIRDQVALEPVALRAGAEQNLHDLATRVQEVAERVGRGGDAGGLLGPLENDAAGVERDLIVASATRRETRDRLERARELRQELVDRGRALQQLVRQCLEQVSPAPRYAVPDVDALGPVPNTAAALQPYLDQLEQVGRAMQVVQHSYSGALAEHTAASGLLGAYRSKARALGLEGEPAVGTVLDAAATVLAQRPTPLPVVTALLGAGQEALSWASENRPARRPTPQEVSR